MPTKRTLAELSALPNLKLGQAARLHNVSPSTLTRWANEGIVRFVTIKKQRRFDVEDLALLMRTGDAPRRAAMESHKKTTVLSYQRANKQARQRVMLATTDGRV